VLKELQCPASFGGFWGEPPLQEIFLLNVLKRSPEEEIQKDNFLSPDAHSTLSESQKFRLLSLDAY
jgi:hypothetical protein